MGYTTFFNCPPPPTSPFSFAALFWHCFYKLTAIPCTLSCTGHRRPYEQWVSNGGSYCRRIASRLLLASGSQIQNNLPNQHISTSCQMRIPVVPRSLLVRCSFPSYTWLVPTVTVVPHSVPHSVLHSYKDRTFHTTLDVRR
jgi:hypothetical protein